MGMTSARDKPSILCEQPNAFVRGCTVHILWRGTPTALHLLYLSSENMSSDNRVFHGPSAATEWRYLAEGGAHIILRYLGADRDTHLQSFACQEVRTRGRFR